jgi:tRNA-dihydrouridine synthase B
MIQGEAVRLHVEEMLRYFGEHIGLRIARKHIGWYSRGRKFSSEFKHKINRMDNATQVIDEIDKYFSDHWKPALS